MKKLRVNLGKNSYDIIISKGLLSDVKNYLPKNGKIFIVSNKTVYKLYGKYFSDFDNVILIPDGEKYKNFKTYKFIIDKLLEKNIQRNDTIIALGGGVIGDITGFCASTVLRGVSYIQIPTTLLSQTDSSVGGKTAIDHKMGKNLIGAFYQPSLVLIDTETLHTLDKRQFMAGMGEVVKYAFIENTIKENDESFLMNYLFDNNIYDDNVIEEIVYQSCLLKALVVERDEKEEGLRAVLNFGHTFGHALEKITNYNKILHGEGVVFGIKCAFNLSYKLNFISEEYKNKAFALIDKLGLSSEISWNIDKKKLIGAFKNDKKVKFDKVTFILPKKQGFAEPVQDIDDTLIEASLP